MAGFAQQQLGQATQAGTRHCRRPAVPAHQNRPDHVKTIRRLIYVEALKAVAFVTLGFLSLFFFFDFVDELQSIGKPESLAYGPAQALVYVTLLIPSHLYELLPITVLIGCIFVMARLAQSSEYTILRTSGLGPWRALRTLLLLGVGFVFLTFAIGDYIAPASERTGQLLKSRYQGTFSLVGNTGAWLKEKRGNASFAVNVVSISRDGSLRNARIFEFDESGYVRKQLLASSARILDDRWVLSDVELQDYNTRTEANKAHILTTRVPQMDWPTTLTAEMVSVALLRPDRMSTIDLFDYISHLEANGQTAQRYEIQFWRKVFYPLSCLVMVVLALPFAYLHFRQTGITTYVFGGVMIGISFFLLNNVFGYLGNLSNWSPWLTAAAPGLIYSVMSLAAFSWLVLRR
jgi:lipopolysaccharide export system permease protein